MVQELDEFTFHSVVSETKGVSLVFFTGPHCASCHHLRDLINSTGTLFEEMFSGFSALEVKADKATALVNEFNVFHLPTMFLYMDGNFHCELQSYAQTDRLIEAIELALSKPAEEEP